jgi:orotidine-5'-phosphate decarboxylase
VDALTVNPYIGIDGSKPFIDVCKKYHKGICVLVKQSNKSSGKLQDIIR